MVSLCFGPWSLIGNSSRLKPERSLALHFHLLYSHISIIVSDAIRKWSNKCFGIQNSLIWKYFLRSWVGAPIFRFQGVDQTAVSHSCSSNPVGWRGLHIILALHLAWFRCVEDLSGRTRKVQHLLDGIGIQYGTLTQIRGSQSSLTWAALSVYSKVTRNLLAFAPLLPILPTTVTMAPFLP